jgi:hypothetical protein
VTKRLTDTWIDPEERAYPNGGFTRRARVRIRANSFDPEHCRALVGQYRMVRASIPDTFSTIPARLRTNGCTIRGFVSWDTETAELTFTPENRFAVPG